jgi:protein-S-isoprenylcysteine O-methyltransferase Ste14
MKPARRDVEAGLLAALWAASVFVLIGTAGGLAIGLVPACLFARWTRHDRHLQARAVLHVIFYGGLMLAALPALVQTLGGGGWRPITFGASWATKLVWQVLMLPGVLLLTAVQEFVARGRGTPMPGDAPRRLVTTGAYAYVANPMQLGKSGLLATWGLLGQSPWVVAATFGSLVYSLGVACPREDRALTARFGEGWTRYRRSVPRWRPRWRPHYDPQRPPARVWLDSTCGPCAQLGLWLSARGPVGLVVVPAGIGARRMVYDSGDGGPRAEGVVALARVLEHVHLGWAFLGWAIRLPLVAPVAQLVADAVGAEARDVCSADSR